MVHCFTGPWRHIQITITSNPSTNALTLTAILLMTYVNGPCLILEKFILLNYKQDLGFLHPFQSSSRQKAHTWLHLWRHRYWSHKWECILDHRTDKRTGSHPRTVEGTPWRAWRCFPPRVGWASLAYWW